MTIDPKSALFQAILSMDSYNRGYSEGIKITDGTDVVGSQLGAATIFLQSDFLENSAGVNIGFYALSYQYSYLDSQNQQQIQPVISYRGTDDMIVEWNNEAQEWQTSLDVNNGYNVGAGIADTPQSRMSFEFYRAVADALNNNNPADPYAANISVTGHSLGAGFAGLVGAIYGKEGVVFDNMAFELAANDNCRPASVQFGAAA